MPVDAEKNKPQNCISDFWNFDLKKIDFSNILF